MARGKRCTTFGGNQKGTAARERPKNAILGEVLFTGPDKVSLAFKVLQKLWGGSAEALGGFCRTFLQ